MIIKRFLGVLLCLALVLSLMPSISLTAYADGNDKTISGLGTGTIKNPYFGGWDSQNRDNWNKVYFGSKSDPILFNVLNKSETSFGGNTLFLDCRTVSNNMAFNSYNGSSVWSEDTNNIRNYLSRTFMPDRFTTQEIESIASSIKSDNTDAVLTGEKLFLLDKDEAHNTSYGYGSGYSMGKYNGSSQSSWWLRSPYDNDEAYKINNAGSTSYAYCTSENSAGVSPALNVNLSSVIFSSLVDTKTYKLTILDSGMTIARTSGKNITRNETTVTVPYTISGTNASNTTQVSVVMTDGTWNASTGWSSGAALKYYGKLSGGTSSPGTFTLPSDYDASWKTYIVAESVNSGNATDYASAPVEITIPTLSVTLSGGANASASPSGKTTQTGLIGAMATVTYTANTGYQFPASSDYYTTTNGITVARTNETTVTVSGTPTANATITVPDAAHTHSFTYTAGSGETVNTVTATCIEGCPDNYNTTGITLTLNAPTDLTYDGDVKTATISGYPDSAPTGLAAAPTTITYYASTGEGSTTTSGEALTGAPSNAGDYVAQMTWGEQTASVAFSIGKATLTGVSVTQEGTLTYSGESQTPGVTTAATAVNNQTVTFTYSKTETGTYGDMPTVTDVADGGTYYYKATAPNHNDFTGSFIVTVNKADQTAPAAPTKASATISSITLKAITNGQYKKGDGDWQNSPTFTGLDMNTEYTFYQRLAEDDNHNASSTSQSTTISTNNHVHEWTYAAEGAILTATCGNTDGGHGTPKTASLTIEAPTLTTYGEKDKDANATITGSIDGVTNPDIVYKKGTQTLTAAPTDAGTYTANITLGEATASVEYTISKAEPTATAPTGLTATYGQTLDDVTLTNPDGNTEGVWAWAVATTTSVGDVGENTFKANYTPTDTANYNSKSDVDVTVTVNKAANPATVSGKATVIKGGNTFDLADNVTKNGATGDVSYELSEEANGCTISGSVLTSGDNTGTVTVYVTVAADSNYKALATTPITVTITDKNTQTITASDVTVTYGDTDKKVSATTDGKGAISYAVKEGSADYIDVNATSGALTIKKAGTATIVVTAAETSTWAQATKEVTVTINKANAVAATVTANNRTYDGTEKPLVTVTGQTTGGEIWYALGTDATTAPADNLYTKSILNGTNAGTYYVWYKVEGDKNHNSTEAKKITVIIEKATPSFKTPKDATISCNQTLNDITLETGFSFANIEQALALGENTVKVNYTPTDINNYNVVENIEIKVIKKHVLTTTKAVEPTCEIAGNSTYYTCSVCDKHFSDEDGKIEIAEGSWVIAAKVHTFDKEVVADKYLKSAADCTHKAVYYKSCECGEKGTETFETGEVLGHNYGEPTYTWSDDYKSCTAMVICKREGCTDSIEGHKVIENAVVTSEVKEAATTEKKGTTTYTATFTNELFETQTKDVATTPVVKEEGTTLSVAETKAEVVVTSKPGEEPTVEYKGTTDDTAKEVIVPDTVTVDGVTYKVTLIVKEAFKDNKTLEKATVGENIETVGDKAFAGCTKLKTVVIKESVKEIGNSAFEGCSKLSTVTLGNNVETVGNKAFANCKSLTKIIIPKSTKKIGNYAFKGNKKFKTIIVKTTKLTDKTFAKRAFSGVGNKVTIKVPKSKKKAYTKLFRKRGLSKKVKVI